MNELKRKELPIVFAVDDNYAPFLAVSVKSIMENASPNFFYRFFVLNTGLNKENIKKVLSVVEKYSENAKIECVDVAEMMKKISGKVHLRDYYTNAIFYRVFIPSLFPNYEKILYLDCDMVFAEDVSKLFDTDLENCVFGATKDEIVPAIPDFAAYVEEFLGVDKDKYFNSGLLLFNTKEYKKQSVEQNFIDYMLKYKFEIAPDQDCLNVLCKDNVKYIDPNWNKTPMPELVSDVKDCKAIHFKMKFRPWRYDDILCQELFWKYAKDTPYYKSLMEMRNKTTKEDKKNDEISFAKLVKMAREFIDSERNFLRLKTANA